jgi:hypothetical protein
MNDRDDRIDVFSVGYARITHGGLTDTEIQMARFEIPQTSQYEDNPVVVTDPSAIADQSILFNSK